MSEILAADQVAGLLLLEDMGDDLVARVLETEPALAPVNAAGCIDLRPLCLPWAQWSSPSPAQVEAAAAQFHLTLADALVARATQVASERGVRSVVLGGGCFFNRILAERCVAGLQAQGLRVHTAQALSCGDAGLALGQAWVAAQQLAQAQQSMDSEETAACA